MREIKFRGKAIEDYPERNIKKGDWVYGYFIGTSGECGIAVTEGLNYMFGGVIVAKVDCKTVGVYTGLKDRNNKKIYEGDIVLIPSLCKDEILEDGSGPEDECPQISEIVRQEGCFGIMASKDEYFDNDFYSFREIKKDIGVEMKEIEVIGNIFDNPELKGGK